jgi:hypothetical protein
MGIQFLRFEEKDKLVLEQNNPHNIS